MDGYVARGAEVAVARALNSSPVVIVEGGRATGKTTLCRRIVEAHDFGDAVDLSDPFRRAEADADPVGFVARLRTPAVIDEAQLVDDLTLAVKLALDARPGPGRFLLTGSRRLGRGALGGTDPLAGRAQWVRLWPLCQRERSDDARHSVLEALFDGDPAALRAGEPRPSILARARTGGLPTMPGVLPGDDRPHDAAALGAYVEGTVHLAIGDRYDNARLARFYRHVAANPAQLLNVSRLASQAALDRATVDRYLHALEDGFLLHRVPAYRSLPHKRVGAHPRLHPTDTALAAWAAGLSSGTLDRHPERIGPLLETLVVNELCAQGGWTAERFEILSWRDPGGAEVDVVIEDDAGRLVAIEVKAAERVDGRASRGIDAFRRRHGLCRGFVLHTGTVTAPLGDPAGGTWAVPIAALWTA